MLPTAAICGDRDVECDMRNELEDVAVADDEVVAEDLGAASALTCDAGNRFREMNGQPLVWA